MTTRASSDCLQILYRPKAPKPHPLLFMLILLCQTPLLSNCVTPEPNYLADQPTPMGLTWDTTPDQSQKLLKGRLEFIERQTKAEQPKMLGDLIIVFAGKFAGLETETIELEFEKERLIGFSVVATATSGSLLETEKKVVKLMEQKYGPANGPPLNYTESVWRFANDTLISIDISSSMSGVVWMFLKESFVRRKSAESKERIMQDF